jgi:hypothetical protein
MVARLTIGENPLKGVVGLSRADRFEAPRFQAHPLERSTSVAWLRPESGVAGIFLKEPTAAPQPLPETATKDEQEAWEKQLRKSQTLEVFSFNTKHSQTESNVSHAERQFVEWFDRQFMLQQRVTGIALFIERSPCGLCASQDLVPFARDRRHERGNKSFKDVGVQLTLHFTEPHLGKHPTNVAHIADLGRAGWKVTWDKPVTRIAPEQRVHLEPLVGSYSRRASRPRHGRE